MNASSSSRAPIDALAGETSATGNDCEYLEHAVTDWAGSRWNGSAKSQREASASIASHLRELTGHDESTIASCLVLGSREDALQQAIVLCRRSHRRGGGGENSGATDGESDPASSRCLSATGATHGLGMVGRMAGGRVDARDAAWPLVPGFLHAPVETLAQRIDGSVAMVLIAPLQIDDRLIPIGADVLIAIRSACDVHGAFLVVDHRDVPPVGGEEFFAHEKIANVAADAVLMSAGLTGGEEAALLVLSERLAALTDESHASHPASCLATLIDASLHEWVSRQWRSIDVDDLATELAERLARRECVRDLHVTGRSIAIEIDVPAQQWVDAAEKVLLRVATAGEFAVRLQPPLMMDAESQNELLQRIDEVFAAIERLERGLESSGTPEREVNDSDPNDEPAAPNDEPAPPNDEPAAPNDEPAANVEREEPEPSEYEDETDEDVEVDNEEDQDEEDEIDEDEIEPADEDDLTRQRSE